MDNGGRRIKGGHCGGEPIVNKRRKENMCGMLPQHIGGKAAQKKDINISSCFIEQHTSADQISRKTPN